MILNFKGLKNFFYFDFNFCFELKLRVSDGHVIRIKLV